MTLTVLATGPLTTVQDLGRPGLAAQGIGRSGAADRVSSALANRLLGNPLDAAVLEMTAGGLAVRADAGVWVALTGARCVGAPYAAPTWLGPGDVLRLGRPVSGLRSYLAVRGGFAVRPVLGSRSTDVLAGLGPSPLAAGDVLPVGEASVGAASVGAASGRWPGVDTAPVAEPAAGELVVAVRPGTRADWFGHDAHRLLTGSAWEVTGESNRVGLRLRGPTLDRARGGELPSEGMVRGALQVPPSGQPVLFLADHPVTGGYPVIAYVADAYVDRCAQLAPGQVVRFRR